MEPLGAIPIRPPGNYSFAAQVDFMGFQLGSQDILLLLLAPIVGGIGALTYFLFAATRLAEHGDPVQGQPETRLGARIMQVLASAGSGLGHLGLGIMVGLLIAFLFLGSLKSEVSAVGKVLALTMLLGYQAPNFWRMQEVAVSRRLKKNLDQLGKD